MLLELDKIIHIGVQSSNDVFAERYYLSAAHFITLPTIGRESCSCMGAGKCSIVHP